MSSRIIFDAPAKLNLRLRVLAQEKSGFHQIESLFCALELCDEVQVERLTDAIVVNVQASTGNSDSDTGNVFALSAAPRSNLVHRAATAFFDAARLDAGANIILTKRIPIGAGMGGGSSDAAATLCALNQLYGMPLAPDELLQLGAQLGSDVPFFLCGSSLALAWGRGTRIMPLTPLPQRNVLLVVPNESVSTADAYAALAASRATDPVQPAAIHAPGGRSDWSDVAHNAVNDFEPVIFERIPELGQIRNALHKCGGAPALLTGSGSVVFGIFDTDEGTHRAESHIRTRFANLHTIQTRTAVRQSV